MRLSEQAKSELTGRTAVRLRNLIAVGMDKSVVTVQRWIKENDDNNLLTTKKALDIIAKETGLTEDQILEEVTADNAQLTAETTNVVK